MISKILLKFGYSRTVWLEQSKNRVHNQTQKLETVNRELTKLRANYRKRAKELNTFKQSQILGKNKLQNFAKKVKRTKQCDCCEAVNVPLQAHHLWSKSKHPSLAYEVTNGVALCSECHAGYHKKYPHIDDCSPYTYYEYRTDERNKIRLQKAEIEIQELKERSLSATLQMKFIDLLNFRSI